MSQNFFERPFGFNIKSYERTIQQGKETALKVVKDLNPFGVNFEQNMDVYNGKVANDFDQLSTLYFNIESQLRQADKNSPVSFDMQG